MVSPGTAQHQRPCGEQVKYYRSWSQTVFSPGRVQHQRPCGKQVKSSRSYFWTVVSPGTAQHQRPCGEQVMYNRSCSCTVVSPGRVQHQRPCGAQVKSSRSYFWIVVLPGTAQSLLHTGEVHQELYLDSSLARYSSVSEALWRTGHGSPAGAVLGLWSRQIQLSIRGFVAHRSRKSSGSCSWTVVSPGTAQYQRLCGAQVTEVQRELFLDCGLARYSSVSEALWRTGHGSPAGAVLGLWSRQVQLSIRGLVAHRSRKSSGSCSWTVVSPGTAQYQRPCGAQVTEVQRELFLDCGLARYSSVLAAHR